MRESRTSGSVRGAASNRRPYRDPDIALILHWLNRPVGETVARLCVALGLEPDSCIKHGDKWMVRRPDTEYEIIREERRASSFLPQSGEGQAAQRPGWGAAGESPTSDAAEAPP